MKKLPNKSQWQPQSATIKPSVHVALSYANNLIWQDTGKATRALAHNDPVRVIQCPFTKVDFTAPSDSARPLLQTDGKRWWLLFDGVDDTMTYVFSFTSNHTIVAATEIVSVLSYPMITVTAPINTELRCGVGGLLPEMIRSLSAAQGGSSILNAKTVLIGEQDNTATVARLSVNNGATIVSTTFAGTISVSEHRVGARNNSQLFCNQKLYCSLLFGELLLGTKNQTVAYNYARKLFA